MKARISLLSLLILGLVLAPSAHGIKAYAEKSKYTMWVKLDEESLKLDCNLTFEYFNSESEPIGELYFHIYPNAFIEHGGKLVVHGVASSRGALEYSIEGSDRTVLHVVLDREVKPGEVHEILVNFTVYIPEKPDRFGYNRGIFALGNWYPILAVYDDEGWNLDPYYPHGESFYSEVADYEVYLIVPQGVTVAATGSLVEERRLGGSVVQHWKAVDVRDFAMTCSRYYTMLEDTALNGRVRVISYFLPEDEIGGKAALEAAVKAVNAYSSLYGDYPFRELRVAETGGWFGGMEYPQIVFISSRLYDRSDLILEYVVAHEVGHQWWYSAVGNDENDEPWLDEGLTEFSTVMYFEWNYGRDYAEKVFDRMVREDYYRFLDRRGDLPVARPVTFFGDDTQAYYTIVYSKGAFILWYLRHVVGDKLFFDGMREFYRRYRFKVATIEGFKETLEEVFGMSLNWFFEDWVYSSGIPSYSIRGGSLAQLGEITVVQFQIYRAGRQRALIPFVLEASEKVVYSGVANVSSSITVVEVAVNGSFERIVLKLDPQDIVPGRSNPTVVITKGEAKVEYTAVAERDRKLRSPLAVAAASSVLLVLMLRYRRVK